VVGARPASRIFGALVEARDRAYRSGRLGVARLPAPVVSIGNLSVGGSGKTPAVIALGRALQQQGLRIDILSRGYRRASRKLEIAADGREDVSAVGDEPRLIAARLQAPVLVHPDRFRAGLEGERRFHTQIHLLDDGFQHRQLARAFDLVLVAPSDLADRLLPAGRLRELPAALARASAVLWTGASPGAEVAAYTAAPVFTARKLPLPPPSAWPRRPLAFCGLARPESFWATLAEAGIEPVAQCAFRDHHNYRIGDLARLRRRAAAAGADGFITTAKDAMRLPPGLEPLAVLEIEMHIPALAELISRIREACGL
jgi:tetraacyldisaccharide 4'-kinase